MGSLQFNLFLKPFCYFRRISSSLLICIFIDCIRKCSNIFSALSITDLSAKGMCSLVQGSAVNRFEKGAGKIREVSGNEFLVKYSLFRKY